VNKRTTIILSVFILCLVCFLAFWWSQPKLITGNKSDMQQVIIIKDPNYAGLNLETAITDRTDMESLFDAVKNVRTLANRHPGHENSLQFDSDYKIVFIFTDSTIEVRIHANNAYRLLDTRGGSGDPGYTRGNAAAIIKIIKELTDDN